MSQTDGSGSCLDGDSGPVHLTTVTQPTPVNRQTSSHAAVGYHVSLGGQEKAERGEFPGANQTAALLP